LDTVYGDHLVNILLIGQDRRQGQGRQRSDSMILVSINKSNSTITLTSFMRDQYVRIPGYNPNKLNAAYAFGGMKLLAQTLELNFGVKVDGMIEVDFSGFENIITLLGGVKVTLTKAEAKYLNDLYDGKFLDSPVVVGENLLNAKQALVYVGLREIDTDYHRASRQRNVIIGLIEAYRDLPLDKMLSLLDEILPLITTDMSNAKILNYAMACFPMLSTAKIQTLRIPLEGTFIGGLVEVREGFYGWFQYNIDFEANKKALFEVFRRRD
jgi:LCP family protein required for cell wall assembly